MWVSLCLDLNSTTFPEGCLEPVDCDKLLTIFSTPRKLAGLRGVKLAGLRLGCFLSAPFLAFLPLSTQPIWRSSALQGSMAG